MVERKKYLANVAFCGGWSGELVERGMLSRIMEMLEQAAEECFDQDVYNRDLIDALGFVKDKVEKGPMLVAGF